MADATKKAPLLDIAKPNSDRRPSTLGCERLASCTLRVRHVLDHRRLEERGHGRAASVRKRCTRPQLPWRRSAHRGGTGSPARGFLLRRLSGAGREFGRMLIDGRRLKPFREDALHSGCADEVLPIADLRRDDQAEALTRTCPGQMLRNAAQPSPRRAANLRANAKDAKGMASETAIPDGKRSPTKNYHRALS